MRGTFLHGGGLRSIGVESRCRAVRWLNLCRKRTEGPFHEKKTIAQSRSIDPSAITHGMVAARRCSGRARHFEPSFFPRPAWGCRLAFRGKLEQARPRG